MAHRWLSERTIEVGRPYRLPRGKALHRPDELGKALGFARRTADAALLLLDSDDDLPCVLGPELVSSATALAPTLPIAIVLAEREFEAWFLAAAESLAGTHGLETPLEAPPDPSRVRDAKGWLGQRMNRSYSPVIHQPKFAALFDLELAAARSSSFEKLRRELVRLVDPAG
jgi:hypothetical protein